MRAMKTSRKLLHARAARQNPSELSHDDNNNYVEISRRRQQKKKCFHPKAQLSWTDARDDDDMIMMVTKNMMKKVYEGREGERKKMITTRMKMKDDKVDGRARVNCVRAEMLLTDEINYSMQWRCAHTDLSQPASIIVWIVSFQCSHINKENFIHSFLCFCWAIFSAFFALLGLKMSCKSFQCVSERIRNRVEIMIHRCLGPNEIEKKKINHQSWEKVVADNDWNFLPLFFGRWLSSLLFLFSKAISGKLNGLRTWKKGPNFLSAGNLIWFRIFITHSFWYYTF